MCPLTTWTCAYHFLLYTLRLAQCWSSGTAALNSLVLRSAACCTENEVGSHPFSFNNCPYNQPVRGTLSKPVVRNKAFRHVGLCRTIHRGRPGPKSGGSGRCRKFYLILVLLLGNIHSLLAATTEVRVVGDATVPTEVLLCGTKFCHDSMRQPRTAALLMSDSVNMQDIRHTAGSLHFGGSFLSLRLVGLSLWRLFTPRSMMTTTDFPRTAGRPPFQVQASHVILQPLIEGSTDVRRSFVQQRHATGRPLRIDSVYLWYDRRRTFAPDRLATLFAAVRFYAPGSFHEVCSPAWPTPPWPPWSHRQEQPKNPMPGVHSQVGRSNGRLWRPSGNGSWLGAISICGPRAPSPRPRRRLWLQSFAPHAMILLRWRLQESLLTYDVSFMETTTEIMGWSYAQTRRCLRLRNYEDGAQPDSPPMQHTDVTDVGRRVD